MDNEKKVDTHRQSTKENSPRQIVIQQRTIFIFLFINLLLLVVLGLPYLQNWFDIPFNLPFSLPSTETTTPIPEKRTATQASTPTLHQTVTASATAISSDDRISKLEGAIILSLQEGLDVHLFALQPLDRGDGNFLPLTRLTSGHWQDIAPALHPNKNQLAFSTNRDGYWDLYLMELREGSTIQLTHTNEFESSPTWSPDGIWLAYEGFVDGNLEIFILPVDGSQDPIRLTNNIGADYQPAWSPAGRQIAFVSTRGGSSQIWLADLDNTMEDRFSQVSNIPDAAASHPAWSPDGRYLTWGAVTSDGYHNIYVWDSENPEVKPRISGSGDWAVWSPDGKSILVVIETPTENFLTAYGLDENLSIVLPPWKIQAPVSGLIWADIETIGSLMEQDYTSPTPLWDTKVNLDDSGIEGRWNLIELEDVTAPYPKLHDRVDESFQTLRSTLSNMVGWDLLADLENAYIPLSAALSPGTKEEWHYTGRAFSFNTLPINAGWMVVVREDFGQRTYWRIYLRARFQDGTQGKPLYEFPWDFNSRYSGRPLPYDQGGDQVSTVPGGYWVDMTHIAMIYGWERLPALSNWQSSYPSARFNEFVFTEGLNWISAMLEVYPREVLLTLTPAPTSTASNTPSSWWLKPPVPIQTATPIPTSTRTSTSLPPPSSLPDQTKTISPEAGLSVTETTTSMP